MPSPSSKPSSAITNRVLFMVSLIVAGEAIFTLPFHVTRFFRPTFVEVLDLTQSEIGRPQALYGVVAMISYLLGGMIADRFPVRTLLAFSLVITGMTGFYFATSPSLAGIYTLYAFWGCSTILPFWAALIKATRVWGGHEHQGIAFGVLDGGRGLFAALLALIALSFFSGHMPVDDAPATIEQKSTALRAAILTYTSTCFAAAAFVVLFVPSRHQGEDQAGAPGIDYSQVLGVLGSPLIWLQAVIIIAAYCMFKGADYYSQFAYDVWGMSEEKSAWLSSMSTLARPVAAILAGLLADRFRSTRVLIGSFLLSGLAYVTMIVTPPSPDATWLLWVSVLPGSLGVFAMRGVYFAMLEESSIPPDVTGTAVGVVSFIGFTPEIFMPLIAGPLIDHWHNGPTGYAALYGMLAGVAALGIVATLLLRRANLAPASAPS